MRSCLCLVLEVLVFLNAAADCVQCQGQRSCRIRQQTGLADRISDVWLFEERGLALNPPSVVECALACMGDARCVTFMVNDRQRRCRLHAAVVTNVNALRQANGFTSFDLCRGDSYIGFQCETDADCNLEHSACLDQTCQCEAGYGFSPPVQACIEDCPNYGHEFVGFKDWYITRHNDLELNDSMSTCPGCCAQQCIETTDILCRSLEITPNKCYLSTITRTEVPSEFKYHTSFNITHFQRQCSYQ